MESLNTEHLKNDLKGRTVRGGAAVVASQGSQFFLQMIFTVVLARLLTPYDFGIVAMVTAVTGLAQTFADLGLSEATIQRAEITANEVSALFWINSAVGLGLTIATIALAPGLAWFYKEPRLFAIALVLSPTFLIGGLRVQADALLKRQMRFKSLAVRDVTSYAVGVVVAVTMALEGAGYWAIIAFPLTVNVMQMFGSWLMVKWTPSWPRRIADIGSIVSFGGHVAASYLVGTVSGNLANVLIGWYWAAGPLGIYSRASNLLLRPVNQILMPAGAVAIPALSRTQSDPQRFARYYLSAVNLIMWISALLFGFLFVAAKPVIDIILGSKWRDAAPVFQLLCISALVHPLFQSTNWALISSGRSRRLFRVTLAISVITMATFAFTLQLGIRGMALWYSIVQVVALPFILKAAFWRTDLELKSIGRAILCPVLVCLCGVLSAELALRFLAPAGNIAELLVIGLAFAAICSAALLLPSVRREVRVQRSLITELRVSRKATERVVKIAVPSLRPVHLP